MSRFATTVGVVAAAVTLVVTSAAFAVGVPGAAAEAVDGPTPEVLDLSSREAINRYLLSLGVDPSTVLVQEGPRNYAGPTCPGAGWNCTTATRVVQIATGEIVPSFLTANGPTPPNQAECNASPPPEAELPEDVDPLPEGVIGCVIVQIASDEEFDEEVDQQASCKVETTDSTTEGDLPKQHCTIVQLNETGGDNQAAMSMKVDWTKQPDDQLADQEALAVQETDGGGDNQFQGDQTIRLVAEGTPTKQDAFQALTLDQAVVGMDATGNNQGQATQSQIFEAKTAIGDVQDQNTLTRAVETECTGTGSADTNPDTNSCLSYRQETELGSNQFQGYQTHDLKASSDEADVTQRQGCEEETLKLCGAEESGFQSADSEAKNIGEVVQSGKYTLEAPDGAGRVQIQDPHFGGFGTLQAGGGNDRFKLVQLAVLTASDPDAVQSHQNEVFDSSDGEIDTHSTIKTNDEYSTIRCYGPDGGTCSYVQRCPGPPTTCPEPGPPVTPTVPD